MLERYELNVLDFKSKKDIIPYIEQMFLLLEETYEAANFCPYPKISNKQYKEKYFRYIHQILLNVLWIKTMTSSIYYHYALIHALSKANGKMYPLAFFIYLRPCISTTGHLFTNWGPSKYQKKGVTAIILMIQKTFNKNGYNIVETNPELEENS